MIFEVGDKVVYDGDSEWTSSVERGAVGTIVAVYDLGDEYYDGTWDISEPGYDVLFDNDLNQTIEEDCLYSAERGVHKVTRKVDTVIVEMDVSVAEMLVAVLAHVTDERESDPFYKSPLGELRKRLIEGAEVRESTILNRVTTNDDHNGLVLY